MKISIRGVSKLELEGPVILSSNEDFYVKVKVSAVSVEKSVDQGTDDSEEILKVACVDGTAKVIPIVGDEVEE